MFSRQQPATHHIVFRPEVVHNNVRLPGDVRVWLQCRRVAGVLHKVHEGYSFNVHLLVDLVHVHGAVAGHGVDVAGGREHSQVHISVTLADISVTLVASDESTLRMASMLL